MDSTRLIEVRRSRFSIRLSSHSLLRAARLWPLLAFGATVAAPQVARAQVVGEGGVAIAYPLPNNTLSGASKIMFSGIPDGGYASIYVDLTPTNKSESFRLATTQTSYELDTAALSDGKHTLTIVSFSASGRQVGSSNVTFNVANAGSAGVSEDSVRLVNWTKSDVINPKVQRFRIFAISDATITGGSGSESESGSRGGDGGSEGAATSDTVTLKPAPLDHQVDILVRRAPRDVGMVDGAANIRLIVQEGFVRDREGGGSGGSGGSSGTSDLDAYPPGYKGKGNWMKEWKRSIESSQAYTKMIKQSGEEINATKKPSTLPLGDILPTFPDYAVQRGATWNTDLTFVGELTKRDPLRLASVPTSLVGFENVSTPAGFERRCARVEVSKLSLPDGTAMAIARALQTEAFSGSGSGGGGSSSGGGGSSGGQGGSATKPPVIVNYRATLTRTIWFDIAAHQLVRAEDTVDAYFEEVDKTGTGRSGSSSSSSDDGVLTGADAIGIDPSLRRRRGGASVKKVPKSVTYNMRVVKFLDDRSPNPTGKWTGGLGTAHTRDSTREPSLTKANGSDVSNR